MSEHGGRVGQRRVSPASERTGRHATTEHGAEEHPRGTLVLMLLFIVVIFVAWVSIYLLLMGRG
jgi:hypothetical protein